MSGIEHPNYQYPFTLLLNALSTVIYLVIDLIMYRYYLYKKERGYAARDFTPLLESDASIDDYSPYYAVGGYRSLCKIDRAPAIGLAMAFNYVLVCVSNPYTPALAQISLYGLSIVMVVLLSAARYHQPYHAVQWVAVITTLIGAAIPLLAPGERTIPSKVPVYVWYALYGLGSSMIGFIMINTERLIKGYDGIKYRVPQVLAVSNLWGILYTVLLAWFPAIVDHPGMSLWNFLKAMHDIVTFHDAGVIWFWLLIAIDGISNILAAYVMKDSDATYATIILNIGPIFSSIIMATPLFSVYHVHMHWSMLLSLSIVVLATILYQGYEIWKRLKKNNSESKTEDL
jgi:hypothetical protein